MKFGIIEIDNFLVIGSAKVNLADRGLILIQGENDDDSSALSNGAGKSSLMDALCWCLTGTTARGVSGDEVVNNKVGKDTRVMVPIIEGSDTYEVVRHRKHKPHKNALHLAHIDAAGVRTDLTKGTDKLTQEEVYKILGCGYEVFKSAIYAGQEQMPDLPAMTDKSLKMLIEEAAGTEILEQAYKEASQRFQKASHARDTVNAELERARLDRISAEGMETMLKADITRWVDNQTTVIANANVVVADLTAKFRSAKADLDKLDEPSARTALMKEQAKLDAVETERDIERKLVDELTKADSAVNTISVRLNQTEENIHHERRDIEKFNEKVGTPCPSCGKDFCEHDIEDARKLAAERLDVLTLKRDERAIELEDARKSRQTLAERLKKHRASMTDISATSARIEALNKLLHEIAGVKAGVSKLAGQLRDAMARVAEEKKREHPYAKQLERAEKEIELAKATIESLEKSLEEADRKLEIANTVVKVFAPAGVRAHILDTVTPALNDQTAKYLGTLSDGNIAATWTTLVKNAKGELREKFSIEVAKASGSASFAGLSGGEKRKVRIACALALQDLVASRATKPIDLFIGDEIDQALDTNGLERLTAVLEEKARERGTVVVISHNDLKDWVSQILTVRNTGGIAEVKEEIS